MHETAAPFVNLGLIFAVAVGLALLFVRLRLPAVLAYVATGVVLGPPGFGLVDGHGPLEVLAEVGVVLLLFTVGLEFSLSEIRRSWRAVLLGGALQVGLTLVVSAAIAAAFGESWREALVWGFLVSLSSTAVVLRLLDARGEMGAAHGRLVVGILIFQDLCVVPMMLLLPLLSGEGSSPGAVLWILGKAVALVAAILVGSKVLAPRMLRMVARSRNREVFLLAVLAIAALTAYATSLTGLSLALGAFLAGMVLAETEYSHQALADVLPLRAVMMCVFFVTIGMLLDVEAVRSHPWVVLGLFAGMWAVKAGAATAAAVVLRFPFRVAALAGAALAPVGEFSFVMASAAQAEGLLSLEENRLFLAASLLSIAVAPLAVSLSPRILAGTTLLRPLERLLDSRGAEVPPTPPVLLEGHVVIAGLGVGGRTVVAALERVGIVPVIVEMNPETVIAQIERGRIVVYGDITSPEVLHSAGIERAKALVLVISDFAASRRAIEVARRLHPDLRIVTRTRFASEEAAERARGMDVTSEEFAGAVAMAGLVLRRCGVVSWSRVVAALVGEHERLPLEEEGQLGAPPELIGVLAKRTLVPPEREAGPPAVSDES